MPDDQGKVHSEFNTKLTGYYIANFSVDENLTLEPQGGAGINIVLPPGTKISFPDKIGFHAEGENNQRNYVFFEWMAGAAN
jgi:hypothetical protein